MIQQPRRIIGALLDNIGRVVVGKEEAAEYALIALLCRGHVLIEDVPGVGKTTLASALAKSLACSFRRIQFTPDLMPSDVTGFTMVNLKTGEMEFCAAQNGRPRIEYTGGGTGGAVAAAACQWRVDNRKRDRGHL